MRSFFIRAAFTGFALWVVTLAVDGISFVGGDTRLQRVGIILVVMVVAVIIINIIIITSHNQQQHRDHHQSSAYS